MPGFMQLKLRRFNATGLLILGEVDLVLPGEMRVTRRSPFAPPAAPLAGAGSPQNVVIQQVLTELGDLAAKLASVLRGLLRPPASHATKLRDMLLALDLRRMAVSPAYVQVALHPEPSAGNLSALGSLRRWFASRDAGRLGGMRPDIPSLDALTTEFSLLSLRLRDANGERPFSTRWSGASGTIIMKDVFMLPRFYDGCQGYLHLFAHCALKSMNESVVEGMGGVWDRSSPDARHCTFDRSVEEAVVAWNGPWPYHAEAVPFISHSLAHLFGTSQWSSHFAHVNDRLAQTPAWAQHGGKVVGRHKKQDKGKLPSVMYDTPAP